MTRHLLVRLSVTADPTEKPADLLDRVMHGRQRRGRHPDVIELCLERELDETEAADKRPAVPACNMFCASCDEGDHTAECCAGCGRRF